jgi:hypothetical protein
MTTFATISTDTLVTVTGGAQTAEQAAGQNANLEALEGCKQWADASHQGKDYKSGLCDQEFVRRNWGNFAPTPGVTRRQPL